MKLDGLLFGRDDCVTCGNPPACVCGDNQTCVQVSRTCTSCASFQCIQNASSSSSSGGVSTGALAGAIVGALLFVAAAAALVWWYRRRLQLKQAQRLSEEPKELPARAEDVLNRPDPNEKPVPDLPLPNHEANPESCSLDITDRSVVMGQAIGSPNQSQNASVQLNPFEDSQSIQTTGTQGTNVIPIALVPHGAAPSAPSPAGSLQSNPMRPERSPDMDLNLDHLNVSREGTRSATPQSKVSAAGLVRSSSRLSYQSGASYNSDFLSEVPMIVTPVRSQVRQVLGVVKAEVVQAPPSPAGLKATKDARPTARSPLAGASFGPADVDKEEEQGAPEQPDPFSDENSLLEIGTSIVDTQGSTNSDWTPEAPTAPWSSSDRPPSMNSQVGSIIAEVGSATRVHVGLQQASPCAILTPSTADMPRTLHRMTSAKLVSPPTNAEDIGFLGQQQQKPFMLAGQENNRDSSASVISTTSTKADSILESFPFVPPSPISDRPTRSAPRSPLAQQPVKPPSPPQSPLPTPPDRAILGMSTGSQMSTLSAGLGSFPFQLDSINGENSTPTEPPTAGGQRASLDTLALTSDLSSYPLGFDKESQDNYPFLKE